MAQHGLPREPRRRARLASLGTALLLVLVGCSAPRPQPSYRNEEYGFRFTPPAGWSERLPKERDEAARAEHIVVQYKRLLAGRPAWLRVTVTGWPASAALEDCLRDRAAGTAWQREGSLEALVVSGEPAVRAAYSGRWNRLDLTCETVAVRRGERVFLFTSCFPAGEADARDQVRRSIASAAWAATPSGFALKDRP
jgi:hypothetical protein